MKKLFFISLLSFLLLSFAANTCLAGGDCTTIQDGTLYASTGELLTTGYDEFGYNYEAHMFMVDIVIMTGK